MMISSDVRSSMHCAESQMRHDWLNAKSDRAILQHIYERELITKRTMAAINRDCEKIIKGKT